MMKKLYKFYADFYRMGELEGIFVSTDKKIKTLVGQNIYFGEVLGKHSEVFIDNFAPDDCIEVLSEDQEFITKYEELIGDTGFNPLDYFEED